MGVAKTQMQSPVGIVTSWCVTGVITFVCLALALVSPHLVQPFAALFQGLFVELPWPTRFLIATYSWLLPAFFVGLAALAVINEVSRRDLRLKRVIGIRIFLAAVVAVSLTIFVLYLPLLTLASKLNGPK